MTSNPGIPAKFRPSETRMAVSGIARKPVHAATPVPQRTKSEPSGKRNMYYDAGTRRWMSKDPSEEGSEGYESDEFFQEPEHSQQAVEDDPNESLEKGLEGRRAGIVSSMLADLAEPSVPRKPFIRRRDKLRRARNNVWRRLTGENGEKPAEDGEEWRMTEANSTPFMRRGSNRNAPRWQQVKFE